MGNLPEIKSILSYLSYLKIPHEDKKVPPHGEKRSQKAPTL